MPSLWGERGFICDFFYLWLISSLRPLMSDGFAQNFLCFFLLFITHLYFFFRYLKGRWCILVCYDVTTKYPVYCVLMDNINGLQLYLLLLYYDFNKCYYYVDDKESLFYCQIKIKIFSRQMLLHVHCFLFPMGFWR